MTKKNKECSAICNNNGCNCKHGGGCCHTFVVTIPKKNKEDLRKMALLCRCTQCGNALGVNSFMDAIIEEYEHDEAELLALLKEAVEIADWWINNSTGGAVAKAIKDNDRIPEIRSKIAKFNN
jgi:hypothetical protein